MVEHQQECLALAVNSGCCNTASYTTMVRILVIHASNPGRTWWNGRRNVALLGTSSDSDNGDDHRYDGRVMALVQRIECFLQAYMPCIDTRTRQMNIEAHKWMKLHMLWTNPLEVWRIVQLTLAAHQLCDARCQWAISTDPGGGTLNLQRFQELTCEAWQGPVWLVDC